MNFVLFFPKWLPAYTRARCLVFPLGSRDGVFDSTVFLGMLSFVCVRVYNHVVLTRCSVFATFFVINFTFVAASLGWHAGIPANRCVRIYASYKRGRKSSLSHWLSLSWSSASSAEKSPDWSDEESGANPFAANGEGNPFEDETPASPEISVPVCALYDYEGQEQDELSFKAGDKLTKIGSEDDQGWCKGRLKDGQVGLYPANYVEDLQ